MSTVPAPPPTFYVCPGERHAIPRSVHWGRLAALYEKCGECPHRNDLGLLPLRVSVEWKLAAHAGRQPLEFAADGIRGRYLNDLDRQRAVACASAFAAWLWDRQPLIGRLHNKDEAAPDERPRGRSPTASADGPILVVGYDERPSSPDLAVGVVTALRQMGCRTIDVGLATKPVWRYSARHFSAEGGVFVTGAGCEPPWTGLDFSGTKGQPIDGLDAILGRVDSVPCRPTRAAGTVEAHAVFEDYLATLPEWFHALRPLHVVCATPLAILRDLLPRLFAELPCRLTRLTWPRQRCNASEVPSGAERLSAAVRDSSGDVGFLIDEDGETCTVFDEQGRVISRTVWQPWLQQSMPDCDLRDGVMTLGALLQALSLSDAPLSQRLMH